MDSLFTLFRRVTALTNYWNTKIYRRKKKQKTTFIFFCVLESFIIFKMNIQTSSIMCRLRSPETLQKAHRKKGWQPKEEQIE
jgi:hypothetical protein